MILRIKKEEKKLHDHVFKRTLLWNLEILKYENVNSNA